MSQMNRGGNPPWARQEMGQNQMATSQLLYNLQSQLQQQQQMQQQQSQYGSSLKMGMSNQSGLALGNTVSSSHTGQKQRVITGNVTKVHDTFGFVDEEIFFQMNSVKGTLPKLGDRVLVECTYNANMPFKWNATRLQVVPSQPPSLPAAMSTTMGSMNQGMIQSGGYNQPVINIAKIISTSLQNQKQNQMFSRPSANAGSSKQSSRFDRNDRRPIVAPPRKRSPPPRSRSPSKTSLGSRPRSRSPPRHERTISRHSRSPVRKSKPPPRYVVQLPRYELNAKSFGVLDMRGRYSNMYIPSDFFHADALWAKAFSYSEPFTLGNYCSFCVMPKEMPRPFGTTNIYEAADANYSYVAKVMLMACPSLGEMYHKACALTEDTSDMRDSHEHPSRFIEFLVGTKNKGEPVAIGGAWSPSLDGADPENNPRVLINTAIRTTEALTGIDLSPCSKWYRFAKIRYMRPESVHKSRVVPARVETVVIFLPDIWSVQPDIIEWELVQATYKRLQEAPQSLPPPQPAPVTTEAPKDEEKTEIEDKKEKEEEEKIDSEEKVEESPVMLKKLTESDIKGMKVAELREQLLARQLSSKGVRPQLFARLSKALKEERELEEETKTENGAMDEMEEETTDVKQETSPSKEEIVKVEVKEEEEKQEERKEENMEEKTDEKADEKNEKLKKGEARKDSKDRKSESRDKDAKDKDRKTDRKLKEKKLPTRPAIIVHPSRTARDGKFDCKSMSLSVLLDYRLDDTKEHVFEVSLFAEMFNDMLMRDQAYSIYESIDQLPEKPYEKEKDGDKSHSRHGDSKGREGDSKGKEKDLNTKDGDAKGKEGDSKGKEGDLKGKERDSKGKVGDSKGKEGDSKGKEGDSKGKEGDSKGKEGDSKGKERDSRGKEGDSKGKEGDKAAEKESEKEGKEDNGCAKEEKGESVKHKLESDNDETSAKKAKLENSSDEKSTSKKDEASEPKTDDKSDDHKSRDKKNRFAKEDMVTRKPGLLLAYIYFDQNHTGYLEEKDMTEILHLTGLQPSRAQVKQMLRKTTTRDRVMYRKLTDCAKGVNVEEDLKGPQPILGNLHLLAKPQENNSAAVMVGSDMVEYRGSLINIASIMKNLAESDKRRDKMQQQISSLNKTVGTLKEDLERVTDRRDRLTYELDETMAELHTERSAVKTASEKDAVTKEFLLKSRSSLQSVLDVIDVLLPKATPIVKVMEGVKVMDAKNKVVELVSVRGDVNEVEESMSVEGRGRSDEEGETNRNSDEEGEKEEE